MTYLFYKKLLKKKGDVIMVMNSVENYRRKPVKITKDIVAYIIANKNTLIDKGVVKRVSNSCQCIECGKESDIYLTVKGDGSTSMCLNCAIIIAINIRTANTIAILRTVLSPALAILSPRLLYSSTFQEDV